MIRRVFFFFFWIVCDHEEDCFFIFFVDVFFDYCHGGWLLFVGLFFWFVDVPHWYYSFVGNFGWLLGYRLFFGLDKHEIHFVSERWHQISCGSCSLLFFFLNGSLVYLIEKLNSLYENFCFLQVNLFWLKGNLYSLLENLRQNFNYNVYFLLLNILYYLALQNYFKLEKYHEILKYVQELYLLILMTK